MDPQNEKTIGHNDFPKEDGDSFTTYSTGSEQQAGVKAIEAISTVWTKKALIIAYISLLAIANATSLEVQITSLMTAFATSSFMAHSLVSTVAVVQLCVNATIKPTMAKVANVFGRFEAFSLAVFIYVIGYIQQAASHNVQTFASAQIFYSAGSQGLQVLQQIFAADTTDLLNRALFSTLFDVPFLWTTWAGSPVAQRILPNWRWGYGMLV
jgi:MFS family permease